MEAGLLFGTELKYFMTANAKIGTPIYKIYKGNTKNLIGVLWKFDVIDA